LIDNNKSNKHICGAPSGRNFRGICSSLLCVPFEGPMK